RLVAQSVTQRPPERDRRVLDRVVHVDVDVPLRADVHVDERMLRQGGEHVVVERDAGVDGRGAGAVQVDRRGDVGFARGPLRARGALRHWGLLPRVSEWVERTSATAGRNGGVYPSVHAF